MFNLADHLPVTPRTFLQAAEHLLASSWTICHHLQSQYLNDSRDPPGRSRQHDRRVIFHVFRASRILDDVSQPFFRARRDIIIIGAALLAPMAHSGLHDAACKESLDRMHRLIM